MIELEELSKPPTPVSSLRPVAAATTAKPKCRTRVEIFFCSVVPNVTPSIAGTPMSIASTKWTSP